MSGQEEIEQLKKAFLSLGADESQANVMAKQISKRASQWVEERGMERLQAIQKLMELVVAGRSGLVPPNWNSSENSAGEEDAP